MQLSVVTSQLLGILTEAHAPVEYECIRGGAEEELGVQCSLD
jgi:hypothetical protein